MGGDGEVHQAVPGTAHSLHPTDVGGAALPSLSQQQQQQQQQHINDLFAQICATAPG